MQDYFDILRDDMTANYKATQARITKIVDGKLSPLPDNLMVGEANSYYTTVLYFDLVKFSALTRTGSDNLNAALLLNTVIPTVLKVISDFNGITVTILGDQVLALFGLEAREAAGSAKSALQASLYITNFIEHLADKFIGRMLPQGLKCSIGMDQGPVHIASVGRRGNHSLVPIGPPTHIAENLHFLAGDNEIWVGENCYLSLEEEFREKFFQEALTGTNWPWMSTETGESYMAYKFVD
jgi:class 3 adenylate cyclase